MSYSILFTICARAGSKGLREKNIQKLNNRPLVEYTLEAYQQFLLKYEQEFSYITLAINTDSEILVEQIKDFGIPCLFTKRKEELAGDVVGKTDVIADTLMQVEQKKETKYDYVVDLDLTSPIRTEEDIKGVLSLVIENPECNYAYSVVESRRNPYFNIVCKGEDGFYRTVIQGNYTCRQQVPKCYDMNASIYAMSRALLLNPKEERKSLIWIMEDMGVLDIDSERDLKLMEIIEKNMPRG